MLRVLILYIIRRDLNFKNYLERQIFEKLFTEIREIFIFVFAFVRDICDRLDSPLISQSQRSNRYLQKYYIKKQGNAYVKLYADPYKKLRNKNYPGIIAVVA